MSRSWVTIDGYDELSIDQMRDSMSLTRCPDPEAFERGSYLRILQGWHPPDPPRRVRR